MEFDLRTVLRHFPLSMAVLLPGVFLYVVIWATLQPTVPQLKQDGSLPLTLEHLSLPAFLMPGDTGVLHLTVSNSSGQPILSANVTLQLDAAIEMVGGGSNRYSLGTLQPEERREIELPLQWTSTSLNTTSVGILLEADGASRDLQGLSLQVRCPLPAKMPPPLRDDLLDPTSLVLLAAVALSALSSVAATCGHHVRRTFARSLFVFCC